MINIQKISRIYKSDDTPVYALNNVSLSLPSKGMIFIVGKSGSGKSTLLNVIAGFDKPTSGNIYYAGNNINQLSSTELDYYRNSVIGFVFQDYCLIETFSVKQNIKVAYDYKNEKVSDEQISKILESVDLKGFENRYPRQLSAGQKQRVAIARALAKNSKIILADEPTGNLDSKTTTQILDILKEISKKRLVVVVSHNKDDAYKYADRIIEISNGKILKDRIKNQTFTNELEIEGNVISLPNKVRLNEDQLELINQKVEEEKGNITFQRAKEKFITKQIEYKQEKEKIKKTNMGFKNMLKYSWLFFKNQLFSFFLVVFIVTVLITTLSLSLQFGTYDGKRQYEDAISNGTDNMLVIRQTGTIDHDEEMVSEEYKFRFNEEKAAELKKKVKYNGFPLYNYYFAFSSSQYVTYKYVNGVSSINNILICDEEYLQTRFSKNGEPLKFWGDISSDADGVIVTDLAADYIIKFYSNYKFKNYTELINSNHFYQKLGVKVAAVIDAPGDYDSYKTGEFKKEFEDEALYYDYLYNDLSIGYSTNPNYYTKYVEDAKAKVNYFPAYLQSFATTDGKNESTKKNSLIYFTSSLPKEGEVIISYESYNDLFGTNCTSKDKSEFKKETIVLRLYDFQLKKYMEKNLLVIGLSTYTYANPSIRPDVVGESFYKIGEYVTSAENVGRFAAQVENYNFYINTSRVAVVKAAIRVISIFSELFMLLSGIMIISIIVLIVVNTVNIMNRNIYNIGVSRSLGAHLGELGFIYSMQMLIFGILVIIFSNVSDFLSLRFINGVLSNTLPRVIEQPGLEEMTFLYYNPTLSSSITGLVVFLTIISIFVPILAIRLINPVNIIKKKA